MNHGFLSHGRDYFLLGESSMGKDPGQHEIQFTHVVELSYATSVADDVLANSWDEAFVDYQAWQDAGEPEGSVWGKGWSLAWPGIKALDPSPKASDWSMRLRKPMYEAEIQTDLFRLNLIFHSLRWAKISGDTSTISSVVTLLS